MFHCTYQNMHVTSPGFVSPEASAATARSFILISLCSKLKVSVLHLTSTSTGRPLGANKHDALLSLPPCSLHKEKLRYSNITFHSAYTASPQTTSAMECDGKK